MCLHRAPGHFELAGNLCVIAALKQQFRNLLLTETQSNRRIFHSDSPSLMIDAASERFAHKNTASKGAILRFLPAEDSNCFTKIHSIHAAKSLVVFTGGGK